MCSKVLKIEKKFIQKSTSDFRCNSNGVDPRGRMTPSPSKHDTTRVILLRYTYHDFRSIMTFFVLIQIHVLLYSECHWYNVHRMYTVPVQIWHPCTRQDPWRRECRYVAFTVKPLNAVQTRDLVGEFSRK